MKKLKFSLNGDFAFYFRICFDHICYKYGVTFKKIISLANVSEQMRKILPRFSCEKWIPFFSRRRKRHAYTQHSGCVWCQRVSARINIYPWVPRCVQSPLLTLTRARVAYFFSPPCLESTLQRIYNEGKKFVRRATAAGCRINLYSHPQPRRNFVFRKFAAYLWKIISVLRLKLLTLFASGILPLHSDATSFLH